jgi:hypothetical protein
LYRAQPQWAHLGVGAALGVVSLSWRHVAGGLTARQWACALLPFSFCASLQPHVAVDTSHGRLARHAALTMAAGVVASAWLALAAVTWATTPAACGCVFVLLGALQSDGACLLACSLRGLDAIAGITALACGNFGVLLSAAASGDVDAVEVLARMAEVTMGRGGQSGGVATFVTSPDGQGITPVRARVCPGRRQAMAPLLVGSLRTQLRLARLRPSMWGAHRGDASPQVYLGHTRFATSSLPSIRESHPHQWTPPHSVAYWRVGPPSKGCALFASAPHTYGLFITHNGDFDFLHVGDRDWPQADVGTWLTRVLHCPCPAKCDSAKVAGCVELFRTQGLWRASFRLAYQDTVARGTSVEEAVFGAQQRTTQVAEDGAAQSLPTMPTAAMLDALGALGDRTCAAWIAKSSQGSRVEAEAAADSMQSWFAADATREPALVVALAAALNDAPPACGIEHLNAHRQKELAAVSVSHFIRGDLFAALRRLMAAAKGSFGLAAACSLDAGTVALAALNQPMSMAFEPDSGLVMYASEATALAVPLRSPAAAGGSTSGAALRLDINSVLGEVWEVSVLGAAGSGSTNGSEASFHGCTLPVPTAMALRSQVAAYDDSATPLWPFGPAGGVRLRLHNVNTNNGVASFDVPSRLIAMQNNSFLLRDDAPRMTTARSGADRVENDLRDCSRVLDRIRATWHTLNAQSADALFVMLRQRALDVASAGQSGGNGGGGRLDIDVLVTGCETSLWIAEQFASDLQTLFPYLRVVAISANKVIGVLGNARGAVSATGFSFCRLTAKLGQAVCLAMSHSGQTFGTLHATAILERACPGRVFVVTGAVDTKMGATVGQRLAPGSPFCARIFTTNAGWRAAEPASVSALAMHHLCTELLLHLAQRFTSSSDVSAGAKPLGLRFSAQDVADLYVVRDAFVGGAVPSLTGVDAYSRDVATAVHADLVAQGRRWAWNILEAPFAWAFCATYITLAVVFGVPLFRTMLNFAIRSTDPGQHISYDWTRPDAVAPEWTGLNALFTALFYVAGALDAGLFIFLPAISTCTLRFLQRRPVLARVKGCRVLVIADVPFVHQLLEMYVSKLFALSYGIAGLDVHGSNPADHLVHRFTHRVSRGVMLAFGRPDGRLCSQTKVEGWTLMALLQARTIQNLGTGPEVLTVGHNSYRNSLMDTAIVLPTHRPRLLCESVLGVKEHEPLARLAALEYAVDTGQRPQLSEGALHSGVDSSSVSRRYAPDMLQKGFDAPIGVHLCCAPIGSLRLDDTRRSSSHEAGDSQGSGDASGIVTAAAMAMARRTAAHLTAVTGRALEAEELGSTVHGATPNQRAAVLSGLTKPVVDLLESQADVETFIECRFLAAERYTAFLVLFHAMAARVAGFWPLTYDVSRSQSCLRVATTASPVSAADLVRTYQAGTAAGLDESSYHGGFVLSADDHVLVPGDVSFRGAAAGSMRQVRSALRLPRSRSSTGTLSWPAPEPGNDSWVASDGGTVWGAHAALLEVGDDLESGAGDRWWADDITAVTSGAVPPPEDSVKSRAS